MQEQPTPEERLLKAVLQGDQEQAKQLLQQGASVHTLHPPYGQTVLHAAAASGQLAMVQLLVEMVPDPDIRGSVGQTALHSAAVQGHVGVAAFLMACGASHSATDDDGCTPLFYAAYFGHTAVAKVLIWAGSDVGAKNAEGKPPLQVAGYHGHHQAVSLLLASGAAVDSVDNWQQTPLHAASAGGAVQAVRVLLDAGAAIDATDEKGWTPLFMASWEGHDEVVGELLQRGAQPDVRCSMGCTALHWACEVCNPALVRRLLQVPQLRAHINTPDEDGITPLCLACSGTSQEVVQLLLAAGADVNHRSLGSTPLHIALATLWFKGGTTACLEALLAAGADANAQYGAGVMMYGTPVGEGINPLQYAVNLRLDAAVPLLATPTNLRPMQQLEGLVMQNQMALGVYELLCGRCEDATKGVECVEACFTAVLEVFGASWLDDLLERMHTGMLGPPWSGRPMLGAGLLEAAHAKWLGGMPWLQRKWRVTNRLQKLVIQPLQQLQQQQQQQQQPQQQQDTKQEVANASAPEGEAAQLVPGGQRPPSDLCLRLWTEAEAAAHGGYWRLFVQRLQQLTELRQGWATYDLRKCLQGWGATEDDAACLCAALVAALCGAQQQQPATVATHAQEVTDAVLGAVQAWEQQRLLAGSSRLG
jgi:ankyrin repeat protein